MISMRIMLEWSDMKTRYLSKILCGLAVAAVTFTSATSGVVYAEENDVIANDSDIKVTNNASDDEANVEETEDAGETESGVGTKPAEFVDNMEGTIPSGIYIGENDASGMNAADAQKIVDDYLSKYDDVAFTLTVGENSIKADSKDLGLCARNSDVVARALNYGKEGNPIEEYKASTDLENNEKKVFALSLTADIGTAASYLEKNKAELVQEAVDNTVKRVDGKFEFVEGTPGVALMSGKSAMKIAEFVEGNWDGKDASLEMLTAEDKPQGSREELAQIQDQLSGFSTNFGTVDNGRTRNVKVGASKLDGLVVYPGQVVSVADTIGPTTEENGYFLAGSYENGTTVETYGGGICQVSSTLYNAVIRAELEVVTRSAHSMIVNYVEPSMDAAIADGVKDFQFRNNGEYPIYIEGYTSGGNLFFNIYGKETRPANRKIEFVSEVTSQEDPEKEFVPAPDQPIGYIETTTKPHIGYTARLWKIEYVDGVEVSRTVFNNSKYKPSAEIISVGVMTGNVDAQNAVLAAIESKDEMAILTAVANNSDEAIAAAQQAAQEAQAAQQAQQAAQQAAQAAQNSQSADPNAAAGSQPADSAAPVTQ